MLLFHSATLLRRAQRSQRMRSVWHWIWGVHCDPIVATGWTLRSGSEGSSDLRTGMRLTAVTAPMALRNCLEPQAGSILPNQQPARSFSHIKVMFTLPFTSRLCIYSACSSDLGGRCLENCAKTMRASQVHVQNHNAPASRAFVALTCMLRYSS